MEDTALLTLSRENKQSVIAMPLIAAVSPTSAANTTPNQSRFVCGWKNLRPLATKRMWVARTEEAEPIWNRPDRHTDYHYAVVIVG